MDNIRPIYPPTHGDIQKEDTTASTTGGVLGALQSWRGWAEWIWGTNPSTDMEEVEKTSCVASEDGMRLIVSQNIDT